MSSLRPTLAAVENNAASYASSTAVTQAIPWERPRLDARLSLRLLWRSDLLKSGTEMLYPTDVQFSVHGLLVYDHGTKQVRSVESSTGHVRFQAGRKGSGPGEFNRPVSFFGRWDEPYAIEFGTGRVTSIQKWGLLTPVRVAETGRWASGCSWERNSTLLQASSSGRHDYYVSTHGGDAHIVDSLALPWERLIALGFMARQAPVRQIDDSTCALLPVYNREFALVASRKRAVLGLHVEALPPARTSVSGTAKRQVEKVAPGAKTGARDARAWRETLLVLFEGQSRHRNRALDVYDRQTLRYRGSVELPLEGNRIAVHGDTLAIVGEVDFAPVVGVFVLSQENQPRQGARGKR